MTITKEHILIVDDEEAIVQTILRRVLLDPRIPFDPLVASDGYEALDFLRSHTIAVVLLDIQMRNLNGLEVIRQTRDEPNLSAVPIIVSSGCLGDEARAELSRLGIRYFLDKPYTFEQLIHKIQEAVGH